MPKPILSPFLPHGLLGFYAQPHYRRKDWETILAIMYDDAGKATHALTDRTDYGFTYCADGPVVLDYGCGCIHTQADHFLIDGWRHHPDRCTRVWLHPHHFSGFMLAGVPLTRQQAAERGWHQLDTPLPQHPTAEYDNDTGNLDIYNPFKDTTHADTIHYYWCSVCREHYTSDGVCHHMKWQEGGAGYSLGCGSEDLDEESLAEAKTSLFHLLRLLPPAIVQRCYEQLQEGTFCLHCPRDYYYSGHSEIEYARSKTRKITFTDHKGRKYQTALTHHAVEIRHRYLGDENEAADLYWPGLAWLGSLDEPQRKKGNRTAPQYALTLGWFYEFLQLGRRVLPATTLHLVLDKPRFEALLALDPNDEDALETQKPLILRRRDLDGTRNTHRFLQAPEACQHIHLACKRGIEPYRSLTYLCQVRSGRPTPRSARRYAVTLKRCLDHNGQHPSEFASYKLTCR